MPQDARMGELLYDADQVFHIQTAKGTATHIILGPEEKIVSSAAGIPSDCSRQGSEWCFVAQVGANELFVQPRTAAPTRNNLQLTTNLRRYSFEFVQLPGQADKAGWFRVTFRYTQEGGRAAAAPLASAQRCNWNYSMSNKLGASALAPLAVFDNGRDTFLMLAQGSAVPGIDGLTGSETLQSVPGKANGRIMMLPGVRQSFAIRSASSRLVVWNEGGTQPANASCPIW
jgi:type IV secretory pathway VirB9-like protein